MTVNYLVEWNDVNKVLKKITMPPCIIINIKESIKHKLVLPTN